MNVALPDFLHPVTKAIPVVHYGTTTGTKMEGHDVMLEKGFYFALCTAGAIRIAEESGEIRNHPTDLPEEETGAESEPKDRDEALLHAGDLLLLSPSRTASLRLEPAGDTLECIFIDPDYFDTLPDGQPLYNQLSGYLNNGRLPVIRLDERQYDALRRTTSLFTGFPSDTGLYDEDMLRHLCGLFLLQTAGLLYRHRANAPAFVRRPNEIFRSFKRLAVKNYRTAHDIAFYAGQLHISPTYLSRIVKQVTGHTVKVHLTELICADARRLLSCSDLDIKEIADMLGFSDQSAFGKFFVRQTGRSPLRFRRERSIR